MRKLPDSVKRFLVKRCGRNFEVIVLCRNCLSKATSCRLLHGRKCKSQLTETSLFNKCKVKKDPIFVDEHEAIVCQDHSGSRLNLDDAFNYAPSAGLRALEDLSNKFVEESKDIDVFEFVNSFISDAESNEEAFKRAEDLYLHLLSSLKV